MKKQRGFLTFVAVFLIMIIGFLGVAIAYQFANGAAANSASYAATQSYYTSLAGLEYATRQVLVNGVSCSSVNYSNLALSGVTGTVNVTGTVTTVISTLNGALTAAATSIPITSTVGFSSSGVVTIDNELITYGSISGNTLQSARRGMSNTAAVAHLSGVNVAQSQCALNSTANVPTSSSGNGQRITQQILPGTPFSLDPSGTLVPYIPAVTGIGSVSLAGTSIVTNGQVTSTSSNFSGSTVLASGGVVINNLAGTRVNSSGGILVTSSAAGSIQGDIKQNYSTITSGNLFGYFFSQTKATIQANATSAGNYYSTGSVNLNGITGKTIWVGTDWTPTSTQTIGSTSSPVLLIVNGNVNTNAIYPITVYGFLYAMQGIALGGSSTIVGAMAAENAINMNNINSVTYDAGILARLALINTNGIVSYGQSVSTQEVTH